MKRKIFIVLCIIIFAVCLKCSNFIKCEEKLTIVNLIKEKDHLNKKMTKRNILLEKNVNSYVVDEYYFCSLDFENMKDYLKHGGIIILKDSLLNNKRVYEKIGVFNQNIITTDNKDYFCSYFVSNGNQIIIKNVLVVKMTPMNINYTSNEATIEEEVLFNDITSYASTRGRPSDIIPDDGGNTGGMNTEVNPVDMTGREVAFSFIETYYYNRYNGVLLGTSTLYTRVFGVSKWRDNNGIIRGVYDIKCQAIIDAESDYKLTNYTVKMRTSESVLDSSYLYSTTETTVSLGGSIGFEGTLIQGGLDSGQTYSFNPDSQNIINDLPAGQIKQWIVSVVNSQYNASKKIEPAIRILNDNDLYASAIYTSIESITFVMGSASYTNMSYEQSELWWDSYGVNHSTKNVL